MVIAVYVFFMARDAGKRFFYVLYTFLPKNVIILSFF